MDRNLFFLSHPRQLSNFLPPRSILLPKLVFIPYPWNTVIISTKDNSIIKITLLVFLSLFFGFELQMNWIQIFLSPLRCFVLWNGGCFPHSFPREILLQISMGLWQQGFAHRVLNHFHWVTGFISLSRDALFPRRRRPPPLVKLELCIVWIFVLVDGRTARPTLC